jgi:hypothetical protein
VDGKKKLLRRESDLPTLHPIPPLLDEDERARPTTYLFDLDTDPGEHQNLADSSASEAAALFEELRAKGWYVPPEALLGMKATALELDPELTTQLNDLGYGGGEDGNEAPRSP